MTFPFTEKLRGERTCESPESGSAMSSTKWIWHVHGNAVPGMVMTTTVQFTAVGVSC